MAVGESLGFSDDDKAVPGNGEYAQHEVEWDREKVDPSAFRGQHENTHGTNSQGLHKSSTAPIHVLY
jgi:hypothetical protein